MASLPEVKYLSVEDGLSHNWVTCITKDNRGFMWFGTVNGLNRYDGVNFKTFKREIDNPTSLSYNVINCLFVDSRGDLWVGTQMGLNLYDPQTETFHVFNYDQQDSTGIGGISVESMIEDNEGNLWIGTSNGLDMFDRSSSRFIHYRNDPADPTSLRSNKILAIERDPSGKIWIATLESVDLFDPQTAEFTHYSPEDGNAPFIDCSNFYTGQNGELWLGAPNGLYRFNREKKTFREVRYYEDKVTQLDYIVSAITEDELGRLIIGTDENIYISDESRRKFTKHAGYASDINSVIGGPVRDIFYCQDDQRVWIATTNAGIAYMNITRKIFTHIEPGPEKLNHRTIFATLDVGDQIWVGTFGGGVNILDKSSNQIIDYITDAHPLKLQGNLISSLEMDRDGNVWIGSYARGVDVIHPGSGKLYSFFWDLNDTTTLMGGNIYDIHNDLEGNIWVGTDQALNYFDPDTKTFQRWHHIVVDSENSRNNYIRQIIDDGQDHLLILTLKSIQRVNKKTGKFSVINEEIFRKIEAVQCILIDSRGNLWGGSDSQGLFCVDRSNNKIHYFTHEGGLPSGAISGMIEDQQGNLWVSSKTNGLFKFQDAVTLGRGIVSVTFSVDDGLQGKDFVSRATYKSADGVFYFGGQNGLTAFRPELIGKDQKGPEVVLTGFKIFNKSLTIGENSPLKKSITETDEIKLSHNDNVVTIDFAALSYIHPSKNQYAYKLENFESEWNYVRHQSATYTNLSPGIYIFRVKAANNYGVWNDVGTALKITIPPPWWATWWFRIGAFLVCGFMVGTAIRIRTREARRYKEELTHRIEERTAELRKQIAENERMQEVLSQEKALLDALMDNMPDYIYFKDRESRFTRVSQSMLKLFGSKSKADLLGKTDFDLQAKTTARKRYEEEQEIIKTGNAMINEVYSELDKSDKERWMSSTKLPLYDGKLNIVGTFGISKDITKLKQAELATKQKNKELKAREADLKIAKKKAEEASVAKSEFLANMSHEIRTPLNGVIGMTELALESELTEKQREYMNIVLRSSESLLAIINDILDFSKIEAGKLTLDNTQINLADLVESTVSSFSVQAVSKDVELICEINPEIPSFVNGDPVRIRQVLMNLIGNALKFTEHGEVFIKVDKDQRIKPGNKQYPLHISVRDSGMGIPADKLDMIFESFSQVDASTTRKFGGTGLGLAISKRLVNLMGGNIWVESKVGEGSTFHFSILCEVTKDFKRIQHMRYVQSDFEGLKALVVDDSETNCLLIKEILSAFGAEVTTAFAAKEGLDRLKQDGKRLDMVLLDHQMPEIDGIDFARLVQKEPSLSHIKLVLLSSIADINSEDYTKVGINASLTKPIRRNDLLQTVSKLLGKAPALKAAKPVVAEVLETHRPDIRILVAEDNVVNQRVAQLLMSKLGYSIEIAEDGKVASEILAEKEYDLIFMDVQMPFKDGISVVKELRATPGPNSNKPIIAMTAFAMPKDKERCMNAGMNDYISKPIKINDLKEIFEKWVPVEEIVNME